MKKIIINKNPWQTRIAITLGDNVLQNVYFSAHATKTLERAYFKGIVTKVLPGIQTAFVDIGQEKAGFLHISEVDRELAIQRMSDTTSMDDEEPVKTHNRKPADIKDIFTEKEAILVQVNKEPIYEKGAKLTTCFTLPGRFIVLMPNIPRIGISKKIEDRAERQRLRDLVKQHLPEGMGAIIRTTSDGKDAAHLTKDIEFLVAQWHSIQKQFAAAKPKEKLHEDLEISLQVVRDNLDSDVEAVITDDKENQTKIYKFIKDIAPEFANKVALYEGGSDVFEYYGVEKQLNQTLEKQVNLKSGGSLIIESTEAMTVVDVNTGRFTGRGNMEETILKTNLEAAEEIVRQLRLRNIGGLIVIDFIDMAIAANRQRLFNVFEKTLREHDKFQSVVLKVSEFGLVQMTRKRSGKTLVQELTNDCHACHGSGFVRSIKTECYNILRQLKKELQSNKSAKVFVLHVDQAVFDYMTTTEYNAILELEKTYKCKIELASQKNFNDSQYKIEKKV